MDAIRNQKVLEIGILLLNQYVVPILVIYGTFRFYNIFSLANVIAVQQNYVSLVVILTKLPTMVSQLLVCSVSIKRLMNFFNMPNFTNNENYSPTIAIEVIDGCFTWNKEQQQEFKLTNINLRIRKGEKVLIYGRLVLQYIYKRNGSGKTSLMYSLLGELNQSGQVNLNGSVGVATQEPWVLY